MAQRTISMVCVTQTQLTSDSSRLARVVSNRMHQVHDSRQVLLRQRESLRHHLILIADTSHLEFDFTIFEHASGHFFILSSIQYPLIADCDAFSHKLCVEPIVPSTLC